MMTIMFMQQNLTSHKNYTNFYQIGSVGHLSG